MAEPRPKLQDRLAALQNDFQRHLPARMANIQAAWDASRASVQDPAAQAEFFRLVHSLAGAGATFGYRVLGERARDLELRLKVLASDPGDGAAAVVAPLLAGLYACAEQGPDMPIAQSLPTPKIPRDETEERLIYLLDDDAQLCAEVARQLGNYGYQIESFQDVEAAQSALERRKPDAWILDVNLAEGNREGPRFSLQNKIVQPGGPSVMYISFEDSWDARLATVRAGGRAYLTKPLDITALVDQLDRLTGRGEHEPYRILIVDDTELIARHYAEVLQAGGMQTEVQSDPGQLLNSIAQYKPELILMDLYMPGCTGVEAAQVLRQNPAYLNIPIVYLSTESGFEQQMAALRVGGDDFLKKPIDDAHLLDAVAIRVERFRTLSNLMARDSLTGLYNHITLKLALESELERAHRSHATTTFAMIDIDHFKSVNDRFGHPVGDAVIKNLARLLTQRLRKSDIVGRYGGEEFALILGDTDAAKALVLLNELRTRFADITHSHGTETFTVSFSAGIATAPPQSAMHDLITAADQALYQAKRSGRNRVVAAGSAEPGAGRA